MKNKKVGQICVSDRIGFYSALSSVILFIVYTVCFIAILMVNPLFKWTNISDFAAYQHQYSQIYKYIGMLSMLLFGICYVIMLTSIHEHAVESKKVLAKIGIYFGLAFDILLSINYFVQISAVRFNIDKGMTDGLEQFVQGNPLSVITSINIMAWTLFLGISSLFTSQVFSGGRLENVIKFAFIANGIILLLGGAGYVLDVYILVFLCVNFGMALPLLVATTALSVLFRKKCRQTNMSSS